MKTLEHKNIKTKKRNCFNALMLSCFHGRSGQSLVEIIIALAIGSIIIGSASAALVVILRSGTTAETQRSATALAQDYIEKTRAYARADWHNIYNLTKGSSTTYYFNASSTEIFTIQGEEGVIANDIRGGLVGYWKFDEESGNTVYDSSGNNNDGTLQSGVVRATSSCKASDCLSFDGTNDYITASIMNPWNSDFTIAMWVKPLRDTFDIFASREVYLVNGFRFGIQATWKLVFWATQSGGSGSVASVNNTLVQNIWKHVVATRSGLTVTLYIDGAQAVQGTVSIVTPTAGFQIGGGSVGEPTQGQIDEVRIYNRALSADEIDHLYSSSVFTRSFYIENVCRRTDNGSYDIIGVAPCGADSVNDPSTQKVNVTVGREESGSVSQFVISDFITRWKNSVFPQSDWSGGVNPDKVITEPDNQYSSSTEIDVSTPGSFRIEGI